VETRQTGYLLAGAFAAFAIWEAVQHLWLMDLPMATYHLVALTAEFGLVVVIALVAMGLVRRQTREDLRQHALRDAVVTTLGRDLRPPLVSLLAELRLLERTPAEGMSAGTRSLAAETAARAGVLVEMVEDLVAMAEEAGRDTGPAMLSVKELAEQTAEPYRTLAKEKGVRLAVELGDELPGSCAAPDQVMQVVSTLVANAVARTAAGGDVELRVSEESGRLIIAVSDTGKPLLGGPAEMTTAEEGAGRGRLRHCQSLAEALGGSARYEPLPEGNRFSFSVPARGRAS
jgi:signal transduction histidine kinase